MKVSFTAKEYTRLLELVHLGLTVAGARPDDPSTMPERYDEIAGKLLELATPFGCADLVEANSDGHLALTEKLTQGPPQEKLEHFSEDVFWVELVARLSERDLRQELGATKLSDELTDEETRRLSEIEDTYWREFETRGVDHLIVLRGGKG